MYKGNWQFWNLFNRMLSEVSREVGCKFNTKAFLVDEAGANFLASKNLGKEYNFREH